MWKKFTKDNNGFTGLEAAIVLVAFVVVAAVFSYVMLGAGFYTTQKSQEVVHTGVTQASSSVELSGDVIAESTDNVEIHDVTVFLQLTSGGSSVDMGKTLVVYSDPNSAPVELTLGAGFTIVDRYNDNGDNLIDRAEKFEVNVPIDSYNVNANGEFQLEIKPPQGATYTIHRKAPAAIPDIMTLV